MSESRDQRLPGLRCCIQLAASSGYEVDEGRGDSVYRFRDDIIKCPYIYDIVLKAIKLISPHPDYETCLSHTVPLSGSEFIFKIIITPAMQQLFKNRLNR
jgi:hypothetical protein